MITNKKSSEEHEVRIIFKQIEYIQDALLQKYEELFQLIFNKENQDKVFDDNLPF
jgi:hypothetical protein